MWKRKYRLMQEAGEDGSGGGDGGAAGAAGSGGNDGAGGQGDGNPPAATGSLLKQGEGGAEPTASEFIPEKYHIKKEDGTLDLEASARKLADSYGHMEKRLGSGDVPPKDVSEYKIEPPEAMGEYNASEDPGMQQFLADAHKAGLTQGQLDTVMKHFFQYAPQLAAGAEQATQQQATQALQEVWGKDEKEFKRHAGLAHVAASAAAERAGLTMEDIEKAGLGNNPVFLRLMSGLGAEFQEDSGPGKAGYSTFGEDDVRKLEMSEAYTNPRHPEHQKVSERVRSYYERKYGTQAVA